MARTRHLHRTGERLSLSWSLQNGVPRARHLGRAAAPPKESFLIKKGGRGRTMQRVGPRVICATTRRTGGDEDALKAFALPFSLENKAKYWYHTLSGDITSDWAAFKKRNFRN
ncbi:hypothetical protein PIB30_094226 [Stylosanthes scabra]|uniref:Retrotransposon gag domain-containing protein n=1 Tax=Stylosanthes scabra TaxID=79078 RepID=A0ABU6ZUC3_9FABA|nr:hypothetical protein [Stylosanthes scabra]